MAHMPQAQGLLYGTKPVMVAIVVQAIWRLGRLALRGWFLLLAGLACFAATLAGVPPIALLLTAGGVAALVANGGRIRVRGAQGFAVLPAAGVAGGSATAGTWACCRWSSSFSNWVWWSSDRATCCWPSCSATWWTACTGSPRRNCWMRSRPGR